MVYVGQNLGGTAWGEEYRPKTGALIEKHGGKVLLQGGSPRAPLALEGDERPQPSASAALDQRVHATPYSLARLTPVS